jgi:colicin import membrane protein
MMSNMSNMSNAIQYSVPQEPGRWPAIALAVIVHAVLFMFLWVGIRWQSDTPETLEAEVWSPQVREAAPPPVPVPPPEPAKEQPPEVTETPAEKPDIALEQEKKKKRAEQEKIARAEQEKAKEEKAAKQQADNQKKEAEQQKKLADEKKRKQDAMDAKKMAQQHADEIRRITAGSNAADARGAAARSQADRADARVKSNIIFAASPADLEVNSAAEFEVRLLPDGSVAGVRITKSSGISGFDEAVRRAIEKSQPYPVDGSDRVPSSFVSVNRPKDQ